MKQFRNFNQGVFSGIDESEPGIILKLKTFRPGPVETLELTPSVVGFHRLIVERSNPEECLREVRRYIRSNTNLQQVGSVRVSVAYENEGLLDVSIKTSTGKTFEGHLKCSWWREDSESVNTPVTIN